MYIGATLGSNLIEEIVLELKRETGSERKAVFEQIDFHIFRQSVFGLCDYCLGSDSSGYLWTERTLVRIPLMNKF